MTWTAVCTTIKSNEQKEMIPLTIASKRIEYFGINLNKMVKTYSLKTIKYCWNKLKKTVKNGKTFCIDSCHIEEKLKIYVLDAL